jgi:phosphoribosylglycinamide formyltransferase 2
MPNKSVIIFDWFDFNKKFAILIPYFFDKMEAKIGTPFTSKATKVMLCGSGELGKEVVIEFQRLGVEVIAVDSYKNAPAHQVADHAFVINMLDSQQLKDLINKSKPDIIVPEIEAISTDALVEAETNGHIVIPNSRAVSLTMNREGIRTLVSETLDVNTSKYKFASIEKEFQTAIKEIGIPCVVKPIMSSSGKGQTIVKSSDDIKTSWEYAQSGGRAGAGRVIVEEFIPFDYEITLLTVRHKDGITFCKPIGHEQVDGDYIKSWQPHPMKDDLLEESKRIATKVVNNIEGYGVFGVELFIKDNDVFFSEVSPRPHDTGLVTLITQDLSEFALHVRAILGLPIPEINFYAPGASHVIKLEGDSENVSFSNFGALKNPSTQIRLFGKPGVSGKRRMGVAVASDDNIENAISKAKDLATSITCEM